MSDQIYYRYEGSSSISFHELKVVKRTNAGVWVDYYGLKKFVLNVATKRFAYPTKEEAFKSFIRRKEKQLAIYKARIKDIEFILEAMRNSKELEYLEKYKHWTQTKLSIDWGTND